MKLLFQQRFFSWFDSYDIYNEAGETVFVVKGELSWGHLLRIYTPSGDELGSIREKVLTWRPQFEMYVGDTCVGRIKKEFSFLESVFSVDYNGWTVQGDWLEWDYSVYGKWGERIATVSKELFHWTDTYAIEVFDPQDALNVLMLVLAIDAEKCSRNK